MLGVSSRERPATIGVVGPASVETTLEDARAAVDAEVSVRGLDDVGDGVPERVDCVVAATTVADGTRTDGSRSTPDVTSWVTEAALRREMPPVVLLAPSGAPVTEALRAGVAEYLPRSVLERGPATVLRRAVGAAADVGVTDYHTIYDNVSEPLTLHDPETGELVHANRRLCELLGYDRAELIAMRVADYTADIEGYDQAAAMDIITSATEDDAVGSVEWPLETKDGEQVWVEATLTPVEVDGRELVLSTATDVTDRRRQHRQLQEITEHVDEVVYLARADLSEVLFVNDAYAELFGQPAERVYEDPMAVLEAVHPEDRAAYRADLEAMSEHVRSGAGDPYEFSHRLRVDGETRWVEVTAFPSRGPGGDVDRVVGVIRDVTERVRRQQEYEQIFDGVNDAITVHDPETAEMVDANETFCEMVGYGREAVLDMEITDFSRDDLGYTTERGREFIRSIGDDGPPDQTEWALETADGDTVWVEVHGTLTEVGGQERFVAIDRDITEAKRREREYEQIFNQVNDAIAVHDPETGDIVDVNDSYLELYGYDRETILEKGMDGLSVTEEGYTDERARGLITSVADSGTDETVEWRIETADGERRTIESNLTVAEVGGQRRVLSLIRDVTEQRRREREYEQIFNGVNDVITIHNPDTGEYIDVNDTLCELTGYSREEILEMGIDGVSVTEEGYTAERAKAFVERVVETGEPDTVEWKVETADGEHRWLEVNGSLATIGGKQRFISLDRDITELKRREREYEQMFNGVNDAIAVFDPDTGEIVEVNERYHELLGYDDLERIRELGIEGLSATEAGYTGERGRALIAEVARTGKPRTVEWQAQRRDGDRVWLEVTLATATIGGRQRVLSIQRDITERKRRQREYEQIFHGVTDVVAVHDPESGAMIDVNDTMCELTGYSREEILDRGAEGLLVDHPDADYPPGAVPEIVDRVMGGESVGPYEQPVETVDGDVVWLEVNPTRAVIGGEERFLAISRDITERRRRRREFEQIFHGVTDIITVYDPDSGELLDVNETMCDLLGYERERILELGPDGVSATELGYDRDTVEQVIREVAETGEPARGIEWALRTASGETLWAEVNATPTELNGRRRVLAIARDVTERRDREERVQVLNRVLRHNLRNDMDAVQGYATDIERTAERERAREHARRIRETAEELLRLGSKARSTEAMLQGDERRRTEPVESVLRTVVLEARAQFDGDVSLRATDGAGSAPVEAGVFRLVVRELVENAAEHGDGSVDVRAVFASGGESEGERGSKWLTIEVADDGPGIPDRVLTPFRTGGETQFEHNHGLGLWLVNWGVRRLGGSIEFDRPEEGGTVARLRLPAIDG